MSKKKNQNPARNLQIIRAYESKELKRRSLSVRIADSLTTYFGTAKFFIYVFLVTSFWIVINLGVIPGVIPFDPYPFILLTMIASVGAIFLTVIVLISQNRQSHINTLRNELLLQLILITERELTKALQLIVKNRKYSKLSSLHDPELREMLRTTDVDWIEKQLVEQITGK